MKTRSGLVSGCLSFGLTHKSRQTSLVPGFVVPLACHVPQPFRWWECDCDDDYDPDDDEIDYDDKAKSVLGP